ncbi:MAG: T9SS type A sorting domain-containing protein, partial [Bacteroidota bacterium]
SAQCPDVENNGELCPDWIICTETIPYSDALTILPPPTADGGIVGMVNVNWIQINQINNRPQNISYACNPSNCKFNSGTYYCIAMWGTTPIGSFGKYNLDIVLDANVTTQVWPHITTTQSNQHESFSVYVAKNEYQNIHIGNDTTILPTATISYSLDTNRYVAALWNGTYYSRNFTFNGNIGNGVHYVSVRALDTLTYKWVYDTVQITVSPNVGIESIENNDYVSFYPNPTNGLVNIEFGDNSSSTYKVELYDLNNRQILSTSFAIEGKNTKTINLSEQPKGIYYIRISNDKSCRLGKIVLM